MTVRRFLYGYLSQSVDPINISLPWRTSDRDGQFKMNYSLEKSIEDNLRTWAKTNWGERPFRFRFGLDAKRYLFEPESIMKEKIKANAYDQLSLYFPFLNIDRVEVLSFEDDLKIPEYTAVFILEAHFNADENKKIKLQEDIS